MKNVMVCLTIPHMKAKDAQQAAQGKGGNVRTAINNALSEIFKRKAIKGKAIKAGTITFTVDQSNGACK